MWLIRAIRASGEPVRLRLARRRVLRELEQRPVVLAADRQPVARASARPVDPQQRQVLAVRRRGTTGGRRHGPARSPPAGRDTPPPITPPWLTVSWCPSPSRPRRQDPRPVDRRLGHAAAVQVHGRHDPLQPGHRRSPHQPVDGRDVREVGTSSSPAVSGSAASSACELRHQRRLRRGLRAATVLIDVTAVHDRRPVEPVDVLDAVGSAGSNSADRARRSCQPCCWCGHLAARGGLDMLPEAADPRHGLVALVPGQDDAALRAPAPGAARTAAGPCRTSGTPGRRRPRPPTPFASGMASAVPSRTSAPGPRPRDGPHPATGSTATTRAPVGTSVRVIFPVPAPEVQDRPARPQVEPAREGLDRLGRIARARRARRRRRRRRSPGPRAGGRGRHAERYRAEPGRPAAGERARRVGTASGRVRLAAPPGAPLRLGSVPVAAARPAPPPRPRSPRSRSAAARPS